MTPSSSASFATSHLPYRPDIDGLRAVAVLAVVIFHAFPGLLKGGFIGVDIFFVISGFLISTIIFKALDGGSFSYLDFYARRVRRIFPALLVVLASCLLFGWFWLLASDFDRLAKHVLGGSGFISNLMLWNEASYFDATAETKPLLHLWSLAIEEQFYVFWPLLLGLLYAKRRSPVLLIGLLGAASFACNVLSFPDFPTAAFYSPASRFWELMVGSALAFFALNRPSVTRGGNVRSVAGGALIFIGLFAIDRGRAFPGWWALLPTAGAVLVISAGPHGLLNRTVLSTPISAWFGKISYPLYLWHWPLLSFASTYGVPSRAEKAVLVVVSIVLAWATSKLVESRFRGPSARGRARQLVVAWGFTALAAVPVLMLNGLPDRKVNSDEARQLVDRYRIFHATGVSEFYQEKCDFYDWKTRGQKEPDPSCTAVKPGQPVYLLWGDSHAQALAFGLRKYLPSDIQLSIIATSGCKPSLIADPSARPSCRAGNLAATEFVNKHRPALVIATEAEKHEMTDWVAIANLVRANGGELVVVGPTPQWRPSLPVIVAKNLPSVADYVRDGLDQGVFTTDTVMTRRPLSGKATYVSLVQSLCGKEGCLARVPSADNINLLVMDYGHLTPAGSLFVARTVLLPALAHIGR